MLLRLAATCGLSLLHSMAQSDNVMAPDRSANDEPLVQRQWNMTMPTAAKKQNKSKSHMITAPLVLPGDSPDKPIRLLFWKKNMDIFGQDYTADPGYTTCGPDLHCEISNDREALHRSHVILFLEQRDRFTLSRMHDWQAAAVFLPTTIMSYIDGGRELQGVDAVLGYSPRWADIVVDHSAGWLRFSGANGTYGEGMEESVEAAWWEQGQCGVYPPDMAGRDYDLAMFNNDCVSLDAVFGGRFANLLFALLQLSPQNVTTNSYGSCLTSHTLPQAIDTRDPNQVYAEMKRHRLVFIHETTRTRDYVSEQIMWALAAGAIPVYIGAPNIGDLMPCSGDPRDEAPCFVDAGGMRPGEVAEVIFKILRERQEFDRFHKWRVMQWSGAVTAKFSALRRGPDGFPCRLCRWYRERARALA